ncbi:polysaccharide deacetylase [bacterium]|nr:MAG: polysaccharide deacetylase [bacterium]
MSVPWPDNRRMAVCLTWDVDGESAMYVRAPDRARTLLSELHQRLYGPQIGIWRVLKLLQKYDLPGTFYVPGYTAEIHPELVHAIASAGHPLGLHGYLHEALETLDEGAELDTLRKSKAILNQLTGYEPRLYRAPSWELKRRTPELLVREGVLSDSSLMDDEAPYALETPAGPLIEIPIHWCLDDAEYWMHSRVNRDKSIEDPESVFRIWSGEFEGYYEEGGCYVLTLHPFVSGRPFMMATVERLIRFIQGFPGVWWTTMDEVTSHAARLCAEGRIPVRHSPPPTPYDSAQA